MRLIAAIVIALALPAYALAGPSIVGSMQGWDPADPGYDLVLNGNGVWTLTADLGPGTHEYKAVDGDAWGLDFPGANQFVDIPVRDNVTWFVNLGATVGVKEGDEYVFDSFHPPTVAGDFQDEVGNPSDWDPASAVTEMADPDLDDVWEYTVVVPAGNYQCKVTLNKNWDQGTGDNVSFTSDGLSPITVTYDMSNNTTTVSSQIVTLQDVTVTFTVCLPDSIDSFFDVCVTGGHDALTNWGDGVMMSQPCPMVQPKLWTVDVLFPAGSAPFVEYKYKKDDCMTWEGTGNRPLDIDDSGPTQSLLPDVWEYLATECPDCSSPVEDASWGTIKSIFR